MIFTCSPIGSFTSTGFSKGNVYNVRPGTETHCSLFSPGEGGGRSGEHEAGRRASCSHIKGPCKQRATLGDSPPPRGQGATPVWNARMCVCGVWKCTHYEGCLTSKIISILKGSSAHLILMSWCNIKLKCIIHNGFDNNSLSGHLI